MEPSFSPHLLPSPTYHTPSWGTHTAVSPRFAQLQLLRNKPLISAGRPCDIEYIQGDSSMNTSHATEVI